jgi:hypothetical protein
VEKALTSVRAFWSFGKRVPESPIGDGEVSMYESHKHPPLPRIHFVRRLALHAAAAVALLLGSLLIGMAGYSYFEDLAWRDGFLNSAMLLGGMGPVDMPKTDGGKIFAALYALYAGLVFIATAGLVFVPVLHRLLHKFHWDEDS